MRLFRVLPIILTTLALAAPPLHFKGKVLAVAQTKIALDTGDGSVLTLNIAATSRLLEKGHAIKVGQLREGDNLDVDAVQGASGGFTIVEARLLERTQVDENAGPPRLTRGRPTPDSGARPAADVPRESRDESIPRDLVAPDRSGARLESGGEGATERPHPSDPRAALIERAQEIASAFIEKLPNYICQQSTTRYQSDSKPVSWHALDVVTANVVYENGREDYRNIAINGRPQNKKMMDIEGSKSTGEFGTILLNLFHPGTQAQFQFVRESAKSHLTTAVYDFSVTKPHSTWDIKIDSSEITPAYRGTVWVDSSNARVMTIFMEAVSLPDDFPIDMMQVILDYDYVRLATETYLLPVKSESIGCMRGRVDCFRNVLEFRNYHKYTGESSITFDKP